LLTEKIDNAQDLHGFLKELHEHAGRRAEPILRRQIAQVATVIRELHRRCLSHRDLKAANILVSRDNSTFFSPFSDQAWTTGTQGLLPIFATSVWLIDLAGAQRYRALGRGRKVQNLTRLNASFHESKLLTRSDRLRFLRTYLRWSLHGKADWKAWWQAIDQATRAKVSRNQRRGRPLT
jgi:serine/threonine protein kinase